MIVTEQIIEQGMSINGGWNFAQIRALGYDPSKKWKRVVIGKDIPDERVKLFLELKGVRSKKNLCFEPVFESISFKDQYVHPNWQKFRLAVFKRDKYQCVNCGERNKTLHAHHLKYVHGKFIWDVPTWYVVTLCEDCHSKEHGRDLRIKTKN